jgi:hypothetical protein
MAYELGRPHSSFLARLTGNDNERTLMRARQAADHRLAIAHVENTAAMDAHIRRTEIRALGYEMDLNIVAAVVDQAHWTVRDDPVKAAIADRMLTQLISSTTTDYARTSHGLR